MKDSELAKKIGKTIENLRKEHNETQPMLQHAIGVSKAAMIAQMEDGSRPPKAEYLYRIAQHYGVSIDYLFDDSKPKSTEMDVKVTAVTTGLTEGSIKKLQLLSTTPGIDTCNHFLSSSYMLRLIHALYELENYCKATMEADPIDIKVAEEKLYSSRWKLETVFNEILDEICDYKNVSDYLSNIRTGMLIAELEKEQKKKEEQRRGSEEENGIDKED